MGIGDWAQSPIPNPQSPIIYNIKKKLLKIIINLLIVFLKNNRNLIQTINIEIFLINLKIIYSKTKINIRTNKKILIFRLFEKQSRKSLYVIMEKEVIFPIEKQVFVFPSS